MSSMVGRRFIEEMSSLIQRNVRVTTTTGKSYSGTLAGVNLETMDVCLTDAKDGEGKKIYKLFISGRVIEEVEGVEKPFDLKSLAERLERLFPRMVRLYEDAGVIVVMDKIRVSEKGVIEGSGPAAERVKHVFEEFMKEHG